MVKYGSFAAERGGPVAPEDTWAEMKDSTESIQGGSRSKLRMFAGVAVAVTAVCVIVFACTGIMGSASAHSAPEKQMAALHAPISVSESSTKAGKVRTAHQRLHLKSIMATPAIHWAQNYLIEQVAQWARTHPTKPGHDGMILILQQQPQNYKPKVQSEVINKLVETRTCDAHQVCEANPVAEEILRKVCPSGKPCPDSIKQQIKQTAEWAAKIATDGAFHGLLEQMQHPPKAPLQHFGPSEHEAAPSAAQRGPPPPGGSWQSPGANTAW